MRLSLEIAALVGMGATLLVLLISVLSMQRDLQIVEDDIARDAHLVATSVAVAARDQDGSQLRNLIERVGNASPGIQVQLVPAEDGPELVRTVEAIVARIPIDGSSWAVEVSESLAPRDQMREGSVRSIAFTTFFVLLLSLAAGLVFGRVLVGSRVTALVSQARRVAQGQFDDPVEVRGSDELTTLATELNLMAGQLRRAQEVSMQEARARLEAEIGLRHADRLRTVGQLSAGVAHELGTPLNVISGRAALLLRALDETDQHREHATTIHEQTERITRIVRRLMDYSRRSPTEIRGMDLGELVADTITLVRPTLTVDIQASLATGCWIEGDSEQLRQVLTNLLLNAAHAATADGLIRVRMSRDDGRVTLIVEDDGPGIPPADRERVLEPFFTTKQPGEGTGLGLAVADGILRDHHGSLDVGESELGGAAFSVALPLERRCES